MFDPKFLYSYVDSNSNLLIKNNLSIKDKCFDFLLVPKCPLFRGSTVIVFVETIRRNTVSLF